MSTKARYEPNFPLKNLLLDAENPRLADLGLGDDQARILRELWSGEAATEEVARSIAENGYYEQDPLFVLEPDQAGDAIVVEGNRRLAAVKVLCDPELAREIGVTNIPPLTPQAVKDLQDLPVWIYPDRESLWSFLGFKHINGAKPWGAFSKAQYIDKVYDQFEHDLDRIAERIGDLHSTVRRLYRGYQIVKQAERENLFRIDDRYNRRFAFSHLYTAVDQPEFQRFLGIDPDNIETSDPISVEKFDELSELLVWLYGSRSKDLRPIIRSQNPDLGRLRETIARPHSLALLRRGYPLEEAWNASLGDDRRLREALSEAEVQLKLATSMVPNGYTGDQDQLHIAEQIRNLAQALARQMRATYEAIAASKLEANGDAEQE